MKKDVKIMSTINLDTLDAIKSIVSNEKDETGIANMMRSPDHIPQGYPIVREDGKNAVMHILKSDLKRTCKSLGNKMRKRLSMQDLEQMVFTSNQKWVKETYNATLISMVIHPTTNYLN